MYIPFRQGDVFRPTQKTKIALEQCFNPFGTGQCLTTEELRQLAEKANSLNPFGTGQCLTTQREKALIYSLSQSLWNRAVSYDLELSDKQRKGQLSQSLWNRAVSYDEITRTNGSASRKSQSLWNRAVSYDRGQFPKSLALMESQSLWNRAVSYDCSGVIKPCATRLTEATSQLFPRLRELGLDLAKF